jgi:hypothetical protein
LRKDAVNFARLALRVVEVFDFRFVRRRIDSGALRKSVFIACDDSDRFEFEALGDVYCAD